MFNAVTVNTSLGFKVSSGVSDISSIIQFMRDLFASLLVVDLNCVSSPKSTTCFALESEGINGCSSTMQANVAQKSGAAASYTFLFLVIVPSSRANNITIILNSEKLRQDVTQALNGSHLIQPSNIEITLEASASFETAQTSVGVWEIVQAKYFLKSCPLGYLLINDTIDSQHCSMCSEGSYSLSDTTGCVGGICGERKCTTCPSGAVCGPGNGASWSHFVPRVLTVGPVLISSVLLLMPSENLTMTYSANLSQYVPESPSRIGANSTGGVILQGNYVWEYIVQCTSITQPCVSSACPAYFLRACPDGHVRTNASNNGEFDSALQTCTPCGANQYIVDPDVPPCIPCPVGGLCQDGIFDEEVKGSIWEPEGQKMRLVQCPPGYILVRYAG